MGAVPLSRHSLGLVLIFATAAIWVVTSLVSSSLVSPDSSGKATVHPFLLTYLATSLFTLYLPLLHIKAWASDLHATSQRTSDRAASDAQGNSPSKNGRGAGKDATRPSALVAMHAAAWATPLWFAAQCTFNFSLARTSVTSNTILSSTSSLFTFFLSILLLSEKFTTGKLAAIVACIAGTALVTLSDSTSGQDDQHNSVLGDVLAVLSAGLYGAYTVVMRRMMPGEEGEAHIAQFFGYLGLFSTVMLGPLVVLLLSMGVFSLSSIPNEAYFVIILEGLLDYVLSDYLWAKAVMLLGPTIATLGLSVQIPMAAGADLLMGKASWIHTAQTVIMTVAGTALILCGFFGINKVSPPAASDKPTALSPLPQSVVSNKSKSSDDEDEVLREEMTGLLSAGRAPGRQGDEESGEGHKGRAGSSQGTAGA